MITPAFSLTATERVLPRMALDFTTASLDSRVTFTRTGNTATVTNSSGYVVPINADLPRFDFNPVTLTCKGLLIEEARTNLISYSEELNNVLWNPNNSPTIVANDGTSPGNTVTADSFLASTALSGVYRTFTVTSGAAHTFSIYLKYVSGGTGARVGCDANPSNGYIDVNTQTGAITAVGGSVTSSSTQNVGNGWFRVTGTYTTTSVASILILYGMAATNKFLAWGFQLEAGSFPTSYIPTVASQVTRTADVATMTGTNFSSWYNQTEGSFLVTTIVAADIANSVIQVSNSSTGYSNLIGIARQASGLNRFQSDFQSGGTRQALLSQASNSFPVNTLSKYCFTYKQDRFAGSTNASAIVSDTSGLVPVSLNRLGLGRDVVGSASYLNGYLQKVFYWPQSLINAELQAFSK
jgi:hypothetical protein